jgi:hypothetical protein
MNGKTHKIRRRLSVIALTASLAAVAIPAATAGGKHEAIRVLGPGLNTVEKQGPYGAYWIRKHEAARVLGASGNTVEKRGPYGAYWVSKAAQENQKFTPSIVDRLIGSPDVRDSADQRLNEPSMCAVHLAPCGTSNDSLSTASIVDRTLGSQDPRDTYREVLGDTGFGVQKRNAQDVFASTAAIKAASANWAAKARLLDVNGQLRRDSFKSAALEHGSNGFLGQTTNQDQVKVRLPRADDPMFREIFQEAAQEHGAAGFGNSLDLGIGLTWKPASVDYSHLPQEDRP